jgi:hypothetical protein
MDLMNNVNDNNIGSGATPASVPIAYSIRSSLSEPQLLVLVLVVLVLVLLFVAYIALLQLRWNSLFCIIQQ